MCGLQEGDGGGMERMTQERLEKEAGILFNERPGLWWALEGRTGLSFCAGMNSVLGRCLFLVIFDMVKQRVGVMASIPFCLALCPLCSQGSSKLTARFPTRGAHRQHGRHASLPSTCAHAFSAADMEPA